MSTFTLKKRDTLSPIEIVLLDDAADSTSVHDLTSATAVWLHVHLGASPGAGPTFSREMDVAADPTTGVVSYEWVPADWTTAPALTIGSFCMEVEVLGPGADDRQTFPGDSYDTLLIVADIGQAL